jgi:hypothetical protein
VVKNHTEEVGQRAVIAVNTIPPSTGSHHAGVCDVSPSVFAVPVREASAECDLRQQGRVFLHVLLASSRPGRPPDALTHHTDNGQIGSKRIFSEIRTPAALNRRTP